MISKVMHISWLDPERREPIAADCDVAIFAAESVLFVTLCFGAHVTQNAVDVCMSHVVATFVALEDVSVEDRAALYWEKDFLSVSGQCVVLRREFKDPRYPALFEALFQRISRGRDAIHVH